MPLSANKKTYVSDKIRGLFSSYKNIQIPKLRNGVFEAALDPNGAGIFVTNLGTNGFLRWDAFYCAVDILDTNGQTNNGNAMNVKLGAPGLEIDKTIEGFLAFHVYGIVIGKSVFRRVTSITGILRAANIAESTTGAHQLTKGTMVDMKSIP